MEQKDKDLLLKDLCGRLPYGVVIQEKCLEHDETFLPSAEDNKLVNIDVQEELVITNGGSRYYIEDVKPYLFPMSSMTAGQRKELRRVGGYEAKEEDCGYHSETFYYNLVGHENVFYPDGNDIDWLDKNNFDYRGLIPMGLAIDATNKNIY